MTEISKLLGNVESTTEAKQDILERAGLLSRDPSSYPNLSFDLDPEIGLDASFRPVAYDTRNSTGKMVNCSVCQQHQKHFDGAIIRLKDGKVGLVGNDCGKRHFFGEEGWTAVSNRWKRESERALFLARFGTAKEQFHEIDRLMVSWCTKVGRINLVRAQFKVAAPKLFKGIQKKSEDGGLVKIEEYQVPYRRIDGEIETRTELRQVLVCQINSEWFFNEVDVSADIRALRTKLAKAVELLKVDATSQNVTAVKRMLRDCRHGLEECARRLEQIAPLRDPTALTRMTTWANQTLKGGDIYQHRGHLSIEIKGRDETKIVDLSALPEKLNAEWSRINEMWPSL